MKFIAIVLAATSLIFTNKLENISNDESVVTGIPVLSNGVYNISVAYANESGSGGGGGGTTDYDLLSNKPQINGHSLTGNLDSASLGLQSALPTYIYEDAEFYNVYTKLSQNSLASWKAWSADVAGAPNQYESWEAMIDDLVGTKYLSTVGGVMTGNITLNDGTQIQDQAGHNIVKSVNGKNYIGATNDHLEVNGKIVTINSTGGIQGTIRGGIDLHDSANNRIIRYANNSLGVGNTATDTTISGKEVKMPSKTTFTGTDTFASPEKMLFTSRGNKNLQQVINDSITNGNGIAVTAAKFAITNGNGIAEISANDLVLNEDESVTYNGEKYYIKGISSPTKIESLVDASAVSNAINEVNAFKLYFSGDANAWFAGTNYVTSAEQMAAKHKFSFESGMDLTSVPCSLALMEKRDGVKQTVWDQRDWTSWYWSFKAAQMRTEIAATNAVLMAAITNCAPAAWAKRTAATGLVNPDATTAWIDTSKITLSPGMAWETVVETSGCAYWTIVGRNVTVGGSSSGDDTGVFTIKDFEGNAVMTIKKTASKLIYLNSTDFVGQMTDSDGRVCFTMRSDTQPIGEYTTNIQDETSFVEESSDDCPADYEWESMGNGVWKIHFILKSSINASACFARFKVEKTGSTTIEYGAAPTINQGLLYTQGGKTYVIKPTIGAGGSVSWSATEK